jgi:putative two-component system response regulator
MKIMVVDDDGIALQVARKVLTSDGHEIILAEDGRQALDILGKEGIRIVISDWNMPNMDGIELCKSIRSVFTMNYIYFILVTSRNSKEDLLSGLSAGADDFITKPFEPAELILRVKNAQRILALETSAITIFSLAKLAESKDSDTGYHLERIREYSKTLAEHIMRRDEVRDAYPPGYADLIFQTSPLHDIGKVGIPDYVLLKPARLNDDEFFVMKKHAEIGAETLQAALDKYPSAEYLRLARDIAWAHHERWDGKGYPKQLKGEEIPLCARIVSLTDVYDALTTKRVYKSAFAHDIARGIIIEGRESQFDPMVVDAFLEIEEKFIYIKDSLAG